MTGVQTCALPILLSRFPVTIGFDWYAGSGNVFGSAIANIIPASNSYWRRDNMFSLRYCNWNKDMFMGMLPNSQFGDIAVVDVPGAASTPLVVSGTSQPVRVGLALQGSSTQNFITSTSELTPNSGLSVSVPASSFNILALRQAEALQKYREITQSRYEFIVIRSRLILVLTLLLLCLIWRSILVVSLVILIYPR